ncbi:MULTISPECIES: AraC family transcriptional regulator [Nocardioides]|uniref:AraC family transcriptional regulator n=1 Tax=Nocardioides vastitatis TaxID=2568655 RepID=A0ABW0ZNU6_9ACTN|nr:AraC family transcriptional regulator [Nocardioides sp.]
MIEELGGDAEGFAHRCALPKGALDNDELLVQDTAIAAILETAARELDCPDLGLRVAMRQDLSMLGPLALVLLNSPSVADALDCTSKYLFVHARNLGLALVPDPRGAHGVLGIRYGYPPGVQAPPQSMDMGLLFLHRALTSLIGPRYGLRTVEIPHAPAAPTTRYHELFGANVHFRQPAAVLRVSSDLVQRPLAGGDQIVRQLALAHLESQAPEVRRAVTGKTRAALAQSLGTGATTVDAVARLLAMSSRTLQRHLAAEGTTFAAVLDAVRRERAASLLIQTDLPIAQIASIVGLGDAATLSRYARRWWHTTAQKVRMTKTV